jgi:hypothetical protein
MTRGLKILFFAPHSAIWVHAFPEALIAEALQQEGNEIVYITCDGQFKEYCVSMSAYSLFQNSTASEKEKICNICNLNKKAIRQSFSFKGYDISETIIDNKLIDDILEKVSQNNFLELTIGGISVGRIALYELLLQYKKINLNFSDTEWSNYLIALKNTLISFYACKHILAKETPDRLIVYNALYSVNHIWCAISHSKGIPTYFLHAGINLSNRLENMCVGKGNTFNFYQNLKSYWSVYKDIPCSQAVLEKSTNHIIEVLKGKSFLAYSSKKSKSIIGIRSKFNIQDTQKILVATMSSYDERLAAEAIGVIKESCNLIFSNQIDWIRSLVKFLQERKDLFLIIRVHPREFPNKRDGVKSEHAKMLNDVFLNLPDNIKINWPTDKLSIYDLAEETDVFLNAWSSVGEEMSLLGIPVVIYSPDLILYPPELNYVAQSKTDFFCKIDEALEDGWNFENIRKVYRWYALKFTYSAIDISESFKYSENTQNLDIKKLFQLIEKKYLKIIYRFSRNLGNQIYYQKMLRECNLRSKSLKKKNIINLLMDLEKNTILDLPECSIQDRTIYDLETIYIKEQVERLTAALYSSHTSTEKSNTLMQNLLSL